MPSRQIAVLISTLMVSASVGAFLARPDMAAVPFEPALPLDTIIPKHFGDWREQPFDHVVNPQQSKLLDKLYSDTLSRSYVNSGGYVIMLSLAHGRDQRGDLVAHMPEICYPASGFKVHTNHSGQLRTEFGEIPVRRLLTSKGARQEPVTYWFVFGAEPISLAQPEEGLRRRLVELRYTASGRIPDGLLFRVSSIDPDQFQANQLQGQFVNDLLRLLPAPERKRLSGLNG